MSSPTTGTTSSALSRRRSASSWSYVLIMSMTTSARRGMGRGRVAARPPRALAPSWLRRARLRGLGHELARHARRLDRRADEHARGERADRGDARAGPQRVVQAVDVLDVA